MSRDPMYQPPRAGKAKGKRSQADAIQRDIDARREGPEKQSWTLHDLRTLTARTPNQRSALESYFSGDHIAMLGAAGVGKTALAVYMASNSLVRGEIEQIILVRSPVELRQQGFVPGTQEEKDAKYEESFARAFAQAFGHDTTYSAMKRKGLIRFRTTSNLRSLNFDNAVIVCDEIQNCNLEELNTLITRTGPGSRLILCGDNAQCDLGRYEVRGLPVFEQLAGELPRMTVVHFTHEDNQRHPLVRAWNRALDDWYRERDLGAKVAQLGKPATAG